MDVQLGHTEEHKQGQEPDGQWVSFAWAPNVFKILAQTM